MTRRCDLCGEFGSENRTIHPCFDACDECLGDLIDNEVERRMERQAEQDSCRDYKSEFRDRQIAAQELKR